MRFSLLILITSVLSQTPVPSFTEVYKINGTDEATSSAARTLKLVTITAENPESKDFAMFVSRRYIGSAMIAIEDIKNNNPYGEWDISMYSKFNFEIVYIGCGITKNISSIVNGEVFHTVSTYPDPECIVREAEKVSNDPDVIGIRAPSEALSISSISVISYVNNIPVFTEQTQGTSCSYPNSISMQPMVEQEIDVIISMLKENSWKRVGVIYRENSESFGFAFGLKAEKEDIQSYKYVISDYTNMNGVLQQIINDDVRILIVHLSTSGSVHIISAITSIMTDKNVLIGTTSFGRSYAVRRDACDDCLRGIITLEEAVDHNEEIESYNERAMQLNNNGTFGVDVMYSYVPVGNVEYKTYDGWMLILNRYASSVDRLINGEDVRNISKELPHIGSITIRGLNDRMKFNDEGGLAKNFYTVNYQSYSKHTTPTGFYSFDTGKYTRINPKTFEAFNMTVFRDGTTEIPLDREPPIIIELGDVEKGISLTVSALSIFYMLFMISTIYSKRKHHLIMTHGYALIISGVFGVLIASTCSLLNGILTNSVSFCYIENFIFGLSFIFVFGSSILKNWRIYEIMENSTNDIRKITAKNLIAYLFALCIPDLIVFIAHVSMSQEEVNLVHISGTKNEYRYDCIGNDNLGWVIPINIYRLVIGILCTYFAIKTLNCPHQFHESIYVTFSTIWTIPLALCLIVVLNLIQDDVKAVFFIKSFFINIAAILYASCLVIPILQADKEYIQSSLNGTNRDTSNRFWHKGSSGKTPDKSTNSSGTDRDSNNQTSKVEMKELDKVETTSEELSISCESSTLSSQIKHEPGIDAEGDEKQYRIETEMNKV